METTILKTSWTRGELDNRPHPMKIKEVIKLAESFVDSCLHYGEMRHGTQVADCISNLGMCTIDTIYQVLIEATDEFAKVIIEENKAYAELMKEVNEE